VHVSCRQLTVPANRFTVYNEPYYKLLMRAFYIDYSLTTFNPKLATEFSAISAWRTSLDQHRYFHNYRRNDVFPKSEESDVATTCSSFDRA
jgi:hypothetical protein